MFICSWHLFNTGHQRRKRLCWIFYRKGTGISLWVAGSSPIWLSPTGLSPVYLLDIRQLAKGRWIFASIGETPPHSQLLKQRILIYDMDSCQFAEHTASFDPYLSDSTPANSICFVQRFCRLINACHNTCRSASAPGNWWDNKPS